jgi:hypothetical protein
MAVREEVERIYRELIGLPSEWSEQEKAGFIEREQVRIERIASRAQADLQDLALTQYRQSHGGASPEHLEHVGMLRQTQLQAQEIALQELYEQIPSADEDDDDLVIESEAAWLERRTAEHRSDPDRWRTVFCSDPVSEDLQLIGHMWPDRPSAWQYKMGELWMARYEDGLPLPSSASDMLAHELQSLVDRHFAEQNQNQS